MSEHVNLNLVCRASAVYAQGRTDALNGNACREDADVFGGYYLDYLYGYREAQRLVPACCCGCCK